MATAATISRRTGSHGAKASTPLIKVVDGTFTAQAFITTDIDDNQITAFHPGAMQYAHINKVSDAGAGIALGIVRRMGGRL